MPQLRVPPHLGSHNCSSQLYGTPADALAYVPLQATVRLIQRAKKMSSRNTHAGILQAIWELAASSHQGRHLFSKWSCWTSRTDVLQNLTCNTAFEDSSASQVVSQTVRSKWFRRLMVSTIDKCIFVCKPCDCHEGEVYWSLARKPRDALQNLASFDPQP